MPIKSREAEDVGDENASTSHADDTGDTLFCGAFVVAIVVGSAWFYFKVMCFAMRFVN